MTTCGIIGFGRIGRRLAARLPGAAGAPALAAILARPGQGDCVPVALNDVRVTDVRAFLERRPDIAVECASAVTLAEVGPALLRAGVDLIPLSLSAFADKAMEDRLVRAAVAGPGRIEIPAGAMGSLGFLAAAREDGLQRVVFRVSKPAATWRRMGVSSAACLMSSDAPFTFFKGSVRDIARTFPGDLNVSVGVALAGLGLDRTEVELIVDPTIRQATFEVDLTAGPGAVTLTVRGRDVAADADPADYTTFSVLRLLRRRTARIAI